MSRSEEAADALGFGVSRETVDRLDAYAQALLTWSKRINLIAPTTHSDIWSRHIVDSLQVIQSAPEVFPHSWCDIGSGGGLPGIVVSIIARETSPSSVTTLIESDKRKSAFLKIISDQLGLNTSVITERIEAAPPVGAEIVSARALAPLPALLGYCSRHLKSNGSGILSKGRQWRQELEEARQSWHFEYDVQDSRVDPDSVILTVRNLRRLDSFT